MIFRKAGSFASSKSNKWPQTPQVRQVDGKSLPKQFPHRNYGSEIDQPPEEVDGVTMDGTSFGQFR